MNGSQKILNKRFNELSELRHVLRESAIYFQGAKRRASFSSDHREDSGLLENHRDEATDSNISPSSVAGVMARSRMGIFERILFRALRGNLYMNHTEIADDVIDPSTELPLKKNVFVIFTHGKELLAKIRKISESMGASLYTVDDVGEKRREAALEVISKIEDLKNVLDNTLVSRKAELSKIAETVEAWGVIVKKEKSVYHSMNLFNYDTTRKALIAEGWCPTNTISIIQQALRNVTTRTDSTIPPLINELRTSKMPPTYHNTNKFTSAFQAIVDAYGIASYQEVNPGLFTCISFPFLFAVMFGDVGHGILVTAFTIWMVVKENELRKKKWGEM
ncbi:H(+)-transporting V0 sector ATPase subunit a [Nowakowskiella sp. JEL0078]|nr:H(+)-transporting V0 sector ATPase subunit a [Nowakowskiella sp. JEL0078]